MVVSGLWATSGSYVATYLSHWALSASYMLAFAVLVRTRRTIFLVFATLALGALVVGAFSFVGYLAHGSQYLASGRGATGLQGDHNYFAVYQAIALPVTLTLAAVERRRPLRLLYVAAVVVIALFALVGVVLVTLLVPSRFFFRRRAQKLSYVGALIVAAAVVGLAGSSPFLTRVQSIWQAPGGVAGHAGSGRIDLWRAAWHGYASHPVLGLGAGNFQAHSIELLQQTPGADTSAAYALKNFVVHNMYLETLADLGPVGLLILLSLIVLTGTSFVRSFRRARRGGDRTTELFSVALVVSLVAYCIGGFFLSIEFNKPLWILIGLALAFDVRSRTDGAAPAAAPALIEAGGAGGTAPPPARPPRRKRDDAAVDERARLERLRALVAAREARVREREAQLAQSPDVDELRAKEAELAEREAELAAEAERLARRHERLLALHDQVDERRRAADDEVERAAASRADAEAKLEARAADLDRRDARLNAELARAAALRAELERQLESRSELVDAQAAEAAQLDERRAQLEAREAEVDRDRAALHDLLAKVEQRSAALEAREAELGRNRTALADLMARADQRARALERAPEPPPADPAPRPAAAPIRFEPPRVPALLDSTGMPTFATLEHLLATHGHEHPDRVEEWGYYLRYLRDFVDEHGCLGESFRALVWDVFEPLLVQ
jgi:O-antigen ligase